MTIGIWTASLLALLAATVAGWLAALLRERDIRPILRTAAFFKKQSSPERIVLGAMFIGMWIFASVKPGGGALRSSGTSVSDEWAGFTPIVSTNTPQTLTADDFRRGFILSRIGTNELFDFSLPSGATACADWRAFGAAEDWVYANEDSGIGNGESGTRLRIHSDGWAEVLGGTASVPSTAPVFSPFRASLGIAPEANWHLIGSTGSTNNYPLATNDYSLTTNNSLFWHFATPSNTLQLTWQNALFNRLSNAPVSVQMEAWPA